MKKLLFFDCEFATSRGGIEKICELGYVMVNEFFETLYKGNIIINPNIKREEWDYRVVKKILTRKIEVYENRLFFPAYYPIIQKLINEADYILGHTISADVHALNCECERYNLPKSNFTFYDIKEFYKSYNSSKKDTSVEKIMNELGINGDTNIHDAGADAYNTMLELKVILEKLEFSIDEMIEICPKATDKIEDDVIQSNETRAAKKAETRSYFLHELVNKEDYSDGTNKMITLKRNGNKKIFFRFLDNVQPNKEGNGILKDRRITFSEGYEVLHFRQMMNLIQIIVNESGTYVLRADQCNMYVTYDGAFEDGTPYNCKRKRFVEDINKDETRIEVIAFADFLKLLNIAEEELDNLPLPSLECFLREDAIIKGRRV